MPIVLLFSAIGRSHLGNPGLVLSANSLCCPHACLTNNKNRGLKPNAGGDPTPVGGPNPREGNRYGQIVRWAPEGGRPHIGHFLLGPVRGRGKPDGPFGRQRGFGERQSRQHVQLARRLGVRPQRDTVDPDRRELTDGNYSNEEEFAGQGNDQMLAGDPATGEIRRFLVGPGSARSRALPGAPTTGRCSSAFSIPASREAAGFPTAAMTRHARP